MMCNKEPLMEPELYNLEEKKNLNSSSFPILGYRS